MTIGNASNDSADISGDSPLRRPEDDRLGYAPFAKNLASALSQERLAPGLVVGLSGAWGSGKSTTVEFALRYLEAQPQHPTPVFFNPWWFSGGAEDLVLHFFRTLQSELRRKSKVGDKLIKAIGRLGGAISSVPSAKAKFAGELAKLLAKEAPSIPELKDRLSELLTKHKTRILVVIDDIDRLQASEIRSLFRLIKAVGNMKNVTYLLAFDAKVVCAALTDPQSRVRGRDYLEKIVQVPFTLPNPDRDSLRRMFTDKLGSILGDTPIEFERRRWIPIFFDGIEPWLKTPRNVVRLSNVIGLSYGPVKQEVNPVDFVAIEALRVFAPEVYDLVRTNPGMFAGTSQGSSTDRENESLAAFHKSWQEKAPNEDNAEAILRHLFPKFEGISDRIFAAPGAASEWARARRVCHPDVLPFYFQLVPPPDSISRTEMLGLLELAQDSTLLGNRLRELARTPNPSGGTRIATVLEALTDYTDDFVKEIQIPGIVETILVVGDDLLTVKDETERGFLSFDNMTRIKWVLRPLLKRLAEDKRLKVLCDALDKEHFAICVLTNLIHGMSRDLAKGDKQTSEPLLREKQLDTVVSRLLTRLQKVADSGELLEHRLFAAIAFRWRDLETGKSDSFVNSWLDSVTADDASFIKVLDSSKHTVIYAGADGVSENHQLINTNDVQKLLLNENVDGRVASLLSDATSGLSPEQMATLKLYEDSKKEREH